MKIFISYSRDDTQYLFNFVKQLNHLISEGNHQLFYDSLIEPGCDWEESIKGKIESADLIIFLVSSSFIASEYIKDNEVRPAMKRYRANQVMIVPIYVRPVAAPDILPYSTIQSLPIDTRLKPISEWESEDSAWVNVIDRIRIILDISKQNDPSSTRNFELWTIIHAAARLQVDIMRILITLNRNAGHPDGTRISEFFDFMEHQKENLDFHMSTISESISQSQLHQLIKIRNVLKEITSALKHHKSGGRSLDMILKWLVKTTSMTVQLCKDYFPNRYEQLFLRIENLNDVHRGNDETDTKDLGIIANHIWNLQQAYVERFSETKSMVNDFDNALSIPYLMIMARAINQG